GDCSPSRSVVSKMIKRLSSAMVVLRSFEKKNPGNGSPRADISKRVLFLADDGVPRTAPRAGAKQGPIAVSGTPYSETLPYNSSIIDGGFLEINPVSSNSNCFLDFFMLCWRLFLFFGPLEPGGGLSVAGHAPVAARR